MRGYIFGTKRFLNIKDICFQFGAYVISIMVVIIVAYSGGTIKVYANLMYVPIAMMASIGGMKQGVMHAVISGLLLGPKMPLDKELNLMQEPINWILILIYV